jgi:hypothetical protein
MRHNSLYSLGRVTGPTHRRDHLHEREQINDTQRTAPSRDRYERIDVRSIGPRPRQRALNTLALEEEHAILTPGLPDPNQIELPPRPRMERMRHPNNLHPRRPIRRS